MLVVVAAGTPFLVQVNEEKINNDKTDTSLSMLVKRQKLNQLDFEKVKIEVKANTRSFPTGTAAQ